MTPKEKAEELIQKMVDTYDITSDFVYDSSAKLCAWIAVDEILNTIEYSSQADELSKISYWQEVKNEINKL